MRTDWRSSDPSTARWWHRRGNKTTLTVREHLRPQRSMLIPQTDSSRNSLLPQFTPVHLSISSHSRCLICNALRPQSDCPSWTLITSSLDISTLVVPAPCQLFFLKTLGCKRSRTLTYSCTYSLIQDPTSARSPDTQGSFSHGHGRGVQFPLPHLIRAFHDAIYSVVVYFSHIQATASPDYTKDDPFTE